MTAPLVPAEVDLRDFQYMELDVRVLRDSRFGAEVTGDAFRAGVMLWCASWHQVPCGSVPDDDIELANLAGYGRFVKEWKKSREQALQGFVKCSDGRLYHQAVCAKAMAAWNSKLQHHFDRARDRLRKANKARAAEGAATLPEFTFEQWNSERISRAVPMEKAEASAGIPQKAAAPDVGIPTENSLRGNGEGTERNGEGTETSFVPPPDPPPTVGAGAPPPEPPTRGTRLAAKAEDWRLPKAWGDWALGEYQHWTPAVVRRVADRFRDHWCAKSGKDATKLDWLATWRNWCSSELTQREHPAPPAADATAVRNAGAKRLLGFVAEADHARV